MYSSTKQFTDFLDQDETKYTYNGNIKDRDIVKIFFETKNISSLCVTFYFDDSGENVAVRVFDLIKFQENKLPSMLAAINDQNAKYRFAKFVIDTDDCTAQVEIDACFREHDIGEICSELLARCVSICDDSYADLMKAIWTQ